MTAIVLGVVGGGLMVGFDRGAFDGLDQEALRNARLLGFAKSRNAPPGAFYDNCAAAQAAGVAPMHAGEPGYRPALDADGDGVACEPVQQHVIMIF